MYQNKFPLWIFLKKCKAFVVHSFKVVTTPSGTQLLNAKAKKGHHLLDLYLPLQPADEIQFENGEITAKQLISLRSATVLPFLSMNLKRRTPLRNRKEEEGKYLSTLPKEIFSHGSSSYIKLKSQKMYIIYLIKCARVVRNSMKRTISPTS